MTATMRLPSPAAAALLLAVAVLAIGATLSGASFVETPAIGPLPWGHVLGATGIAALAAAPVTLAPRPGVVRASATALLVAALGWLPVSIVLAGNLALNFAATGRFKAWLAYTVALMAASVVLLLAAVALRARGNTPAPQASART